MANEEIPTEWYFVTAPQQVSWTKDSRTNVVETYGTNNPYVHYGTTKLRSLRLGDSHGRRFLGRQSCRAKHHRPGSMYAHGSGL